MDQNGGRKRSLEVGKSEIQLLFFHGYLIKKEVVGNRLFHCAHR